MTRNSSAKVSFGSYRGFDVHIVRSSLLYGSDGFRLTMRGEGEQEFLPDNLRYSFDDQFSLSGLFQRMDNFLAKGLDESIERQRENARQESAELETVKAALGKEFPQKDELTLAREKHGAVIRELQRMQDDSNYVSTWEPKKIPDCGTSHIGGIGGTKSGKCRCRHKCRPIGGKTVPHAHVWRRRRKNGIYRLQSAQWLDPGWPCLASYPF